MGKECDVALPCQRVALESPNVKGGPFVLSFARHFQTP